MRACLLWSVFLGSTLAADILPGISWYDVNGDLLQAHGGGIVQVDDVFYLIGENKTSRDGNSGGSSFNSVSCYKSKNLLDWEHVNDLLSLDTSIPDLTEDRVVERPKVIFNEATNKYVMWMHIDSSDYGDAKAGVATSDTVCGDYEYIESAQPLDNQSRDMTLFVDDDQTGYLVGEDRDEGTHFFKLSDDYLKVESDVGVISFDWMPALESPAVVKRDGLYYFFGSQLTGWDPNDNQYTTSESLAGPWASAQYFAPEGSQTCQSQTAFILPIGDKLLYMGDRWFSDNLWESQYIWHPLNIDTENKSAWIECRDSWPTSEVGL